MAKVSRAYIKSAGQDQSGSIQAGSTIYAQDILDLIDSAKWHDEGIENVYYDNTSHGIKVVKSSDKEHPVFIPVPKNSDIVNKLVKGTDKYELHSDSGLVAETDLPSTLVTSVACDKVNNELKVSSTTNDSGITVQLPDSLKSASIEGNDIKFTSLDGKESVINLPDSLKSVAIEGNDITFTSLDGQKSVVNLPDSLKSVSIDGNTLTFNHTNGTPSVIKLPVTTGYLSDVSLSDGTLVFKKDGSSDVRVTLPFVSKAITGVSLQGSNLVFTFSDNTTANITLPTQSEEGTTAGLLSGVRIDGNKLIFTVSGGNDITIELPSTSGDVDLTGLLYEPRYSQGSLYFKAKGSGPLTEVWLDGISEITEVSNDNLYYNDIHGNLNRVPLSSLTKGVLKGASVSNGNLVFTTKDSDNISIPLSSLSKGVLTGASLSDSTLTFTANDSDSISVPLNSLTNGVLTGVSLSDGNLVFTVKGGDNISIPLSSSTAVTDVSVTSDNKLSVTKSSGTANYDILPTYLDYNVDPANMHFGWGGSLAYSSKPYAPLWVPTGTDYIEYVMKSNLSLNNKVSITIGSSTPVNAEAGCIYGKCYNPQFGYINNSLDFVYCSLPLSPSFSESSGTFTANVITNNLRNWDYVLMNGDLSVTLNGNILEVLPASNSASVLHLLQKQDSLTRFRGFAFKLMDCIIMFDAPMFFANQTFDWNFNVTNSFGMRFYLNNMIKYGNNIPFTATAGKVLE